MSSWAESPLGWCVTESRRSYDDSDRTVRTHRPMENRTDDHAGAMIGPIPGVLYIAKAGAAPATCTILAPVVFTTSARKLTELR